LMLLVRALSGLGAAALSVSLAAVGDYFPPRRRGAAVGVVVGLSATSGTLFVPLTGALADLAGWRSALAALGLVAAAVSLLTSRLPATTSSAAPLARLPRGAGWYYLCQVLGSSQYNGTFTYFGAFLASRYHLSTGTVSLIYGLGGLGFFAGSVLTGRTLPPHARLLFIALVGAGSIVPLALMFGAWHLGLTIALVAAFTALRGGIVAALYGATGDLDPGRRGMLLSLAQAASQLGIWLGATAGGAAVAQGGYAWLTGTVCTLALAAALSALAATYKRTRV
ncbi:MAG: MFS transporter, partial [Deinococcus sp.]|nr:MFS transporter [Deinococcus sp.]